MNGRVFAQGSQFSLADVVRSGAARGSGSGRSGPAPGQGPRSRVPPSPGCAAWPPGASRLFASSAPGGWQRGRGAGPHTARGPACLASSGSAAGRRWLGDQTAGSKRPSEGGRERRPAPSCPGGEGLAAAAAAGTSRQPGAASQVPASPVPQRPRSSSIRHGECGRRRKGKTPCARAPRCVAVLAVCLAWPRRSARRLHCRDLGGVDQRVGRARPHQDKVCGAPQVPGATQAPQVRPPGFRIFGPQPRDSGVGRRGCTPLPRWAVLCAGVVLVWPPLAVTGWLRQLQRPVAAWSQGRRGALAPMCHFKNRNPGRRSLANCVPRPH